MEFQSCALFCERSDVVPCSLLVFYEQNQLEQDRLQCISVRKSIYRMGKNGFFYVEKKLYSFIIMAHCVRPTLVYANEQANGKCTHAYENIMMSLSLLFACARKTLRWHDGQQLSVRAHAARRAVQLFFSLSALVIRTTTSKPIYYDFFRPTPVLCAMLLLCPHVWHAMWRRNSAITKSL